MTDFFSYAGRKLIDYWTRVRNISRVLLYAAILVAGASLSLQFSFSFQSGDTSLSISSGDAGLNQIAGWGLLLSAFLFAVGIVWAVVDQLVAHRRESKQTTIVVESRGLRDENGAPLASAVKRAVKGQVEELIVDLRGHMRDGQVIDPQAAANEVVRLPEDLRRRRHLKGREETSVVYGGLTPVPFTFLIGVLLDDEGPITSYDWHRTSDQWRSLNAPDDQHRLLTHWDNQPEVIDQVVLAISCSYPILNENLARSFPRIPVVRMELAGPRKESHWSAEKQSALAMDVLTTATELEGRGVKTVHLVLAAPNSLVFQIGRKWDRRNIPRCIVYQFERDSDPPFAWGVELPKLGETTVFVRPPPQLTEVST